MVSVQGLATFAEQVMRFEAWMASVAKNQVLLFLIKVNSRAEMVNHVKNGKIKVKINCFKNKRSKL